MFSFENRSRIEGVKERVWGSKIEIVTLKPRLEVGRRDVVRALDFKKRISGRRESVKVKKEAVEGLREVSLQFSIQ